MHKRETVNQSPMSMGTQCASKLQELLAGHRNAPSDKLRAVLSKYKDTLEASILETIRSMSGRFCAAYVLNSYEEQGSGTYADHARKQLQLGETLFYKALESFVDEMELQKPGADLSVYLEKSAFQQSLFACCLEIVMFCYNSQREFPWILEVFDLKPYHFFKVIEPLVRAGMQNKFLMSEVFRHLNQIEEQILECHTWKHDSPLWNVLARMTAPECKENPIKNAYNNRTAVPSMMLLTPGTPGVNRVLLDSSNKTRLGSPAGCGHSKTVVQASPRLSTPEASRAPRRDSLALFFRKVYNLAAMRFFDMCKRLGIQKDKQHKIWTCFEHSLVKHIGLMRDRHLDQLLLCALYVGAKVTEFETDFKTILMCYGEHFPKKSHVYQSVYLEQVEGSDEWGYITKFYNEIYAKRMDEFVKDFHLGLKRNDTPRLTPLPRAEYMLKSPMCQDPLISTPNDLATPKCQTYLLSHLTSTPNDLATPKCQTYVLSQRPAKDQSRINEVVSKGVNAARKRISFDCDTPEDEPPAKKPVLHERIEAYMRDCQDPKNGASSSGK
ncbi:hypothetical protein MTO96_024640 [Rhipicephalus appendiculatus]